MPCGLYGKLPSKRDFIAVNMPRDFLLKWEAWMQGAMSAAKLTLANDWLPHYLNAPLWRFWLGREVCGMPVTGVIMSSVDGVGRQFPLSLFACGAEGDAFVLPSDPAVGDWFELAEDFALSVLEPETDYDAVLEKLNLFPLPARAPEPEADAEIAGTLRSHVLRVDAVEGLAATFGRLDADDRRAQALQRSYFWTVGGENYKPACIMTEGMPDPYLFSAMLSGQFDRVRP